ncbi:sensor histidine kinase [Streptomyces olivoreticuli]|uniref:sensor histidine kinase n=1 Tax=Streptomyces olivoreticuli TaxID=68246 RepID=UPI000E28528C|nr:sensor histidine kinase [Streptomyces olivoreticuli]
MERLTAALKAAPRTLREDLWPVNAAPPPRAGQPRWLDWRPAIVVPLVLVALLLTIPSANFYAFNYRLGAPEGILLAGIQSAALVVALFRPVPAWWASTVVMITVTLSAESPAVFHMGTTLSPWAGPGLAVQAGVLFLAALRVRPRVAVEMLVVSVLAGLACETTLTGYAGDPRLTAASLAIAVLVGAALRGRQVARTELVVQEELTAEERARRTLLEERNRIARELHDVVAHHMSVISIQAQVAPHLVENPSEELKENLAGIRGNAVEALTELRRVLGVLRSEDALADGVRHTPQPTLDRLDELVANVRAAGLTVATETIGTPRTLSPGVELSAFRIVQEALSNAMRHAPGAAVRVEIGYRGTGLTVRVTNSAPGGAAPPSPGAGQGLLGMRERTAMLGGELATGATPDGGYEVTALLPTRPPAEPVEDTA